MDRRTVLRGTALAGALAVAGCSTGDGASEQTAPKSASPDTTGDGSDATATPAEPTTGAVSDGGVTDLSELCGAVSGTRFRSVEKHDGGQGPGTVAQVHWWVRFEDGRYEYSHTDVVESGSYSCTVEGGTASIEGATSNSDRVYAGTYDPGSGVLVWDGVRYRPDDTS